MPPSRLPAPDGLGSAREDLSLRLKPNIRSVQGGADRGADAVRNESLTRLTRGRPKEGRGAPRGWRSFWKLHVFSTQNGAWVRRPQASWSLGCWALFSLRGADPQTCCARCLRSRASGKGGLSEDTSRARRPLSLMDSDPPSACTRVCAHTRAFCLHTPEVIMIYDVGGNAAIPRDSRD